ncbi:Polysaccharide export protein [Lentisphaera araneosa HTCC2155]|jgi:polysaccharide biosynthesis/export protein|uniref:Polysaccharide export protein n=1 Tax=Lentisphaera araneosa HTCC2155 TaxID=313628 RepID=A6DJG9_9BACT|nr:polysaccharide biosynthesis/export family protein [Lentisphaera araneosa]EDM28043.1 Polysaccharide export protein [Lentisphaera araneosa HTCC2155]
MRQFLLIIFSLVFVSLAAETNTEKVEATSQQQEEIAGEQKAQKSEPKNPKEAAQTQEYVLGNGDTIKVSIYGNFQAERNLIIDSRGYISFLLTGPVKASGKTIMQLREEIQAIIQKKRKHIIVSVVPLSFNSQSYTIGGQIKFPGKKVLNGNVSILEAIANAGGFKSGEFRNSTVDLADLEHAFLMRDGAQLTVDFNALVLKGKTEFDLTLKNGDYLHIPSALSKKIYTLGEVNYPRQIMYLNSLTLIQAITESRGIKEYASPNVVVIRGSLSKPEKLVFNINDILHGDSPDVLLKPGDIVYVPEDSTADLERLAKVAIRAFVQTVASSAAANTIDDNY